MAEPVADVLTRVANLTSRIGPLLVELLNHPDTVEQAEQLRQLGQHVGALSAELLARAAELDGRAVEPPRRVVIDARSEPRSVSWRVGLERDQRDLPSDQQSAVSPEVANTMTSPGLDEITEQDTADGVQQQVVGAVIEHDRRVLLLRRPADDFRGGTWELPSGKVEPRERLNAGLRREVDEETGLTVSGITSYLGAFDYTSGSGRRTRQHTWSVTVEHSDDVRLTEHDAHAWVSSADEDYLVSAEVQALLTKHRLSR